MTAEAKPDSTQIAEEAINAFEEKPSSPAVEEPTPELEEKQPKEEEEEEAQAEESSKSAKVIEKSSYFKQENNFLFDLKDTEKKALIELRAKLEDEIDGEVSIWGVPLLPSKNNDATDVVLLKFLRAREFKVKESFEMIQNTLQWRKEGDIDSVVDEVELGDDYRAACYMDGYDREGHPVCYNVTAVFRDEEVYEKAFRSEEERKKFLRWRVQVMEKGIQKLDLRSGGVSKLLQVTDLKNSVGVSKKELRDTLNKSFQIMQDNYPEFVSKNILINVPFWYYAFNAVISRFFTQRTKSKFVFARPAQVTETLLK